MPEAGRGVVVLEEALIRAQRDDGLSQASGLTFVAVALQASHEQPVYVDPHRSLPVAGREEGEPVPVVAGHRCEALVRKAEARVLQGVNHASRPPFVGDGRVQGHEVGRDVDLEGTTRGEVEVQVDAVLLVPELLVHRTGRLPRALLKASGPRPARLRSGPGPG